MKESQFIRQNKSKWIEYEKQIKFDNPERESRLFVEISDDLSYSQTFYKNRSVRAYLNGLVQELHDKIYKKRKFSWQTFSQFWTYELPKTLYFARRELLLSTIIFGVAMIVGIYSSMVEPDFAKEILGNSYVTMTDENIAKNDPMAVYKDKNQFDMFFGITVNNLFVAFRTFVMGALFGIGTLLILLYNGIMLGTFQYYFVGKGVLLTSVLTIWQHGTIEIACIVIAGGAGLKLGKSIILPKTFKRNESFRVGALQGIKIMIGIFPLLILAGFIEGYFTRHTEAPTYIRVISIAISLFIMIGYFIVLPRRIAKKHNLSEEDIPKPSFNILGTIELNRVKSISEVFTESLLLIKRRFTLSFVLLLSSSIIIGYLSSTEFVNLDSSYNFKHFSLKTLYLTWASENHVVLIIKSIALGLSLFLAYNNASKYFKQKMNTLQALLTLIIFGAMSFILMFTDIHAAWLMLLFIPLINWTITCFIFNKDNNFKSSLFGKGIMPMILTSLLTSVIFIFISILISSPVVQQLVVDLIVWVFSTENISTSATDITIQATLSFIILMFFNQVLFYNSYLLFHSLKEKEVGSHLKEQIDRLRNNKRIQGFEKE